MVKNSSPAVARAPAYNASPPGVASTPIRVAPVLERPAEREMQADTVDQRGIAHGQAAHMRLGDHRL